MDLDVWAYTGYIFEDIIKANRKDWNKFLKEIDFIIDGPFIMSKRNLSLQFRGSENQRIISVKGGII